MEFASFCLLLTLLRSVSPFSAACLRRLRGSKVASARVPFFLSSPKERKGRLVFLHVTVAPSMNGSRHISSEVLDRSHLVLVFSALCCVFLPFSFSLLHAGCCVQFLELILLSVCVKTAPRLCSAWANTLPLSLSPSLPSPV